MKENSRLQQKMESLQEEKKEAEKLKDTCKLSINELQQDINYAKKTAIEDRSLIGKNQIENFFLKYNNH